MLNFKKNIFFLKKIIYHPLLIISFATIFSILYQGYYFAINDGSFYIPYLKSLADPSLYPNDLLISTWRAVYFADLWKLLAVLVRFIPLEGLLFFLHIVFRFLFFLAVYLLSFILFKKKNIAYLSVIFWFIPKPSLGFDILYNEFVQSGVALTLLLFSIYFFVSNKYFLSFFFLSVVFLAHPPMAGFIFMGFFLYLLYSKDFKSIINIILINFIVAFPIFASAFIFSKGLIGYDALWVKLTRIRSPYHSFPFSWGKEIWLPFLIFGILLIISLLRHRKKYVSEKFKKIYAIILACIILMISGFFFSEIIPIPQVIILVPFHSSSIFTVLSSFFIICFIYDLTMEERLICRYLGYALFIIFFFNNFIFNFHRAETIVLIFTFIVILITNKFYEFKSLVQRNKVYLLIFLSVILILWLPFMLRKNFLRKDFYLSSWIRTQKWVNANTGRDSIFIVPIYLPGFRVYSERTIVADWKDGTAGYLSPDYLRKWWIVMQDFGLTEKKYSENYQKKVYSGLSDKQIDVLAGKYEVKYFISETTTYKFKKVYQNEYFTIYKL